MLSRHFPACFAPCAVKRKKEKKKHYVSFHYVSFPHLSLSSFYHSAFHSLSKCFVYLKPLIINLKVSLHIQFLSQSFHTIYIASVFVFYLPFHYFTLVNGFTALAIINFSIVWYSHKHLHCFQSWRKTFCCLYQWLSFLWTITFSKLPEKMFGHACLHFFDDSLLDDILMLERLKHILLTNINCA